MKPHVHCDAIKAWADGAKIEVWNDRNNTWIGCSDPRWLEECQYRVRKEKKKYRVAKMRTACGDTTYMWTVNYEMGPDCKVIEGWGCFVEWMGDWIEYE